MVKLKDIADQAGVSLSAVSIALNGKRGVAVATRERILKIAHDLKYRQSAKNKPRGTLRFLKIALHGHTINEAHRLFINGYIDGMIDMAIQSGFSLEVISYQNRSVEEIVQEQNNTPLATGLIILGTEFEKHDLFPLRYLKTPFVIIDNINDFLPYDFINMNNRGAVYKVLEHFQRSGLTNIGLIYSDVHTPNYHQRTLAFHELASSLGLHYQPHHLLCVNSSEEAAYREMGKLLRRALPLPQGYFCVNDTIAYGCIRALRESGRRIPEDLSVIGFDDLPVSGVMTPALTTVQVSKKAMGSAAAELLINRLSVDNRDSSHKSVLISGVLVKRESVRSAEFKGVKSRHGL